MEPGEIEQTQGDLQLVSSYIPGTSRQSHGNEINPNPTATTQRPPLPPPEVLQQALHNPAALQQLSYNHGLLQQSLYNPALFQQALQAYPELGQQFGLNASGQSSSIAPSITGSQSSFVANTPSVAYEQHQNSQSTSARHPLNSMFGRQTGHTSFSSLSANNPQPKQSEEHSQIYSHETRIPSYDQFQKHPSANPRGLQHEHNFGSVHIQNSVQENTAGGNTTNIDIKVENRSSSPVRIDQHINQSETSIMNHLESPQHSASDINQLHDSLSTSTSNGASKQSDQASNDSRSINNHSDSHHVSTRNQNSHRSKYPTKDSDIPLQEHKTNNQTEGSVNLSSQVDERNTSSITDESSDTLHDAVTQPRDCSDESSKERTTALNSHEKSDASGSQSPKETDPTHAALKDETSHEMPVDEQGDASCMRQFQSTMESAQFWVQNAENAGQRASQHDGSIQQEFQETLSKCLKRFLLDVKAAAQQCVDRAAKHLPDIPDINESQEAIESALAAEPTLEKEAAFQQRDVKPDPKQLLSPVRSKRGRPRGRPRKTPPAPVTTRKRRAKQLSIPSDGSGDETEVDYAIDEEGEESEAVEIGRVIKREPKTPTPKRRRKTKNKEETLNELPTKDVDFGAVIPKCTECKMPFSSQADLVAHIKSEHKDAPTILTCKHCPKVFTTDKAHKKHIMDVHRKNRKCTECNKTFAYQYELDNHMRVHQGAKKFQCKFCDFSAYKRAKINIHIKAKHGGAADGVVELGGEGAQEGGRGRRARKLESETEDSEEEWYDTLEDAQHFCLICNIHFASSDELTTHIQTHLTENGGETITTTETVSMGKPNEATPQANTNQDPTDESTNAPTTIPTPTETRSVHEKRFQCPYCAENFPGKSLLDTHVALHKGQKPYECDVCESAFKSMRALNLHTSMKHPERMREKPFNCWRCDKAFTFKAKYTAHMERIHKVLEDEDDQDGGEDEQPGEHPCNKCGRTFIYARLLHRHVKRVHNKNLECGVCKRKFAYPAELADHERLHTSEKAIPCDFCQKPYRTRALLLSHAKVQHPHEVAELRYSCRICSARFPILASLENHEKTHKALNSSITETLACDHCYMLFPNQLKLDKHVQNEHPEVGAAEIAQSAVDKMDSSEKAVVDASGTAGNGDKTEGTQAGTKQGAGDSPQEGGDASKDASKAPASTTHSKVTPSHVCGQCGEEFRSYKELSAHRKEKHPRALDPRYTCTDCDKVCENKEALRNHRRRVHGKHRECSHCGKKFAFQYILDRHLLTHTGERNFACQICTSTFYTLKELNTHVKISHVEKAFKCEQCDAKFGTKQSLARHVTHLHTNYRPKRCEFCGKGFVDNRELKAHLFTHTRQSDIKCDQCGQMFGTRSCLNKHIRIKHKGEKKLCPICGKHIVSHLGMHIKSHGEKRFKCHLCPKIYAWPSALKEHIRSHTGEKPYVCPVCGKSFLGSANFVKHKKIHIKNALLGKTPHKVYPPQKPNTAAINPIETSQHQGAGAPMPNSSLEAYHAAMGGSLESNFLQNHETATHAQQQNEMMGANTYAAGNSVISPIKTGSGLSGGHQQQPGFDPSLVQL